jgi:hypothetical protein
MAKFKVGDKVRRIDSDVFQLKVGDNVTIIEVLSKNQTLQGIQAYLIKEHTGQYREDRFELIQPYTKIEPKVGERYRVLKEVKDNIDRIFSTGTILKALDERNNDGWAPVQRWCSDELDLIHHDVNNMHYLTTEYLELVEEECSECDGSGECQHASHFTDCNTSCDCDDRICQKCFGEPFKRFSESHPEEFNKQPLTTKIMNRIKKALLSKDDKTLIEAGYLDSDLDLTSRGKNALEFILFTANKEELVKMAQADLDEQKKD